MSQDEAPAGDLMHSGVEDIEAFGFGIHTDPEPATENR